MQEPGEDNNYNNVTLITFDPIRITCQIQTLVYQRAIERK